jgi:oligosaccharide repeat unit polymerase
MSNGDNSQKTPALPWAVPDPTPFLFLAVGAFAWILVGSSGVGQVVAIAVAALPALVWAGKKVISRPETGVVLIMVAAVVPRWFLEVGGLKARPEHIAAGILLLAIPLLIRNRRLSPEWIKADLVLAAYVGVNIISSSQSIDPSQTIKWSFQQMLAILPYFVLRVIAGNMTTLRTAFRIFLAVGVAEAAFAIFCFYSNAIFNTEIGVEVGQYGDIPGVYGSHYEANILGSSSGVCAVILLAMYLYYRRGNMLLGYVIAFTGMTISLSRGALGATIIGFAMMLFFSWRRKALDKKLLISAGVATLCAMLVVMPMLISRYMERFKNVDVSDPMADDNTFTRFVQFGLAFEAFLEHPVLGNGTSSFQLEISNADLGFESDVFWISNSELRVLHDTGVVGFGLFLAFMIMLIRSGYKVLKRRFRPELFGLMIGLAVYSVAFQFTEGTLLSFTWIHAGLIACFVVIQKADGSNDLLEIA